MAYWAQGLGKRLGVPVVASFHTHFVSYFRHYGLGRFERQGWALLRRFYNRCDEVYAPTVSIREELGANGIRNVELWSRGVDLCAFTPEHRSEAIRLQVQARTERPILLLVSRLVKEKDLADLVAANDLLRSRGTPFVLALVGDGPMREELSARLPEAFFAGHRTGPELADWYASADVFVFPSTTETLGNVVLEALASGLPAVVVDRGGPRDLIAHGVNGFVARSNDPDDLARYLRLLLEDQGLRARMAEAARASAASRDWETINGGLIENYERVIARYRTVEGALR
jgi:glycosyltransferase involved in cell wall biosynthesis